MFAYVCHWAIKKLPSHVKLWPWRTDRPFLLNTYFLLCCHGLKTIQSKLVETLKFQTHSSPCWQHYIGFSVMNGPVSPPFNKSQQRQNHLQKSPTQVLIFNSLRLESCRFKSDEKTHRPKSILQKTQYFVSKWSEILSEALLSKFVWELGSAQRADWFCLLRWICPEHHSKALINL